MERGLFPEPATDAPKQKRAFAVFVIGLVGILLLGLVGIGGLVFLRGGAVESQTSWASWFEVARAPLGRISDSLVDGYRTAPPGILSWTIAGSALVAAIVGYIAARASARSARKRVRSLESRIERASVELEALRAASQHRMDILHQEFQVLRDQAMQVPDGTITSSMRGWMEGVDRSHKKLERDVRTLFLAFGKQRKGDDS
jgi:hypothetical protein